MTPMLRYFFALLAALCLSVGASSQDQPPQGATVIFFAPGGHWHGMGAKLNPFAGKAATESNGEVFDGDAFVAMLSHSHYLVLHLKSGKHTFSASRTGEPADTDEFIRVDLKPGNISYFALTTTVPSLVAGVAQLEKSHLMEVSCSEFLIDHGRPHLKPIESKFVDAAYRGMTGGTHDVASCQP